MLYRTAELCESSFIILDGRKLDCTESYFTASSDYTDLTDDCYNCGLDHTSPPKDTHLAGKLLGCLIWPQSRSFAHFKHWTAVVYRRRVDSSTAGLRAALTNRHLSSINDSSVRDRPVSTCYSSFKTCPGIHSIDNTQEARRGGTFRSIEISSVITSLFSLPMFLTSIDDDLCLVLQIAIFNANMSNLSGRFGGAQGVRVISRSKCGAVTAASGCKI